MAKKNTNRPAATDEDRKKYQEAWAEMMVTIWREKIERLHVIDTYSLHQQIKDNVVTSSDSVSTIQHKFLEYGIYQDLGVGNGYSKDNGGNLEILDPVYRAEHNMGEPRKPRVWFSRSYFASVMVLKEQMAYMYGEEFCGLIVDAIQYNERIRGTSLRNRLWGSHWKNKNKYSF